MTPAVSVISSMIWVATNWKSLSRSWLQHIYPSRIRIILITEKTFHFASDDIESFNQKQNHSDTDATKTFDQCLLKSSIVIIAHFSKYQSMMMRHHTIFSSVYLHFLCPGLLKRGSVGISGFFALVLLPAKISAALSDTVRKLSLASPRHNMRELTHCNTQQAPLPLPRTTDKRECEIIKGIIALGYQFLCWGLALTAEVQE